MDTIETSNLSRTVLFRQKDVGQNKAEVAAARLRELTLENSARVDSFVGDVVRELGLGIYRRANIVLGCLDNVEARIAVNSSARGVGVPWIDAGINELDSSVALYLDSGPCYECYRAEHDNRRFSCSDFKRRVYFENRVATVQVSSALVGALQVQEAVKLLCGRPSVAGCVASFRGSILGEWSRDTPVDGAPQSTPVPCNPFGVYTLIADSDCPAHATLGEVVETPLTADHSLNSLFKYAEGLGVKGPKVLDMAGEGRSFVVSARCTACGHMTTVHRPKHQMFDDEVRCQECHQGIDYLDIRETTQFASHDDASILSSKLSELGVPRLHIVKVRGLDGTKAMNIELTGDIENLLPRVSEWKSP
jgi:adenylyltransferase/sulfurtransferase